MVLAVNTEYTIESAVRETAIAFERAGLHFGHGTETAIDEASWLILHAMGLSPAQAPDYSQMLTEQQVNSCNRLLRERVQRKIPAAYLTGKAWFAGHEFISDSRALVPRSPLAEFINDSFFGVLDHIAQPRILDLCTGGGCIAIACAYARAHSQVDAGDVAAEALALAAENVALHGLEQRVQLLQGSLFEPVSERYSLIISNPPYVDAADINGMPAEFLHEPMLGLAAGDDGLDLVHQMLREASNYLEPDGVLVLEVGNSGEALEEAYPDVEFSWLQFARGGHGVFLLTCEELLDLANKHQSPVRN